VKLKYAHAGGYNPPIVVIHGNQVKDLPDSYKRYLMNYFRKSLDVMGTNPNPVQGRGKPVRQQAQHPDAEPDA
jgi:GTP-binding protein